MFSSGNKSYQVLLLLMIVNVCGLAQAVLPTSWSFATSNLPIGWAQNGTGSYTASGNTAPACKFDDSGDKLTIQFTGTPCKLSYYLAGNSFANGSFIVEQSVDGSNWASVHSHSGSISSSYTLFTDTLSSLSRFIRFNYFNKVSGNIGLDDVKIDSLFSVHTPTVAEPMDQATALIFSTIKSYRISASFTAAPSAPDGYLVLRKVGSAITDIPMDGTVYERGDMIGGSKVILSGNNLEFYVNNVIANTIYYFAIYAFNGNDIDRNYLTSNPLTAAVTSLGSMEPPTYYNSISTANTTFISDLHNKINPHITQSYSNYGIKFLSPFIARDTSGNKRVVTCVYSGENKIFSEPWAWTANGFSREHTFCQSWMPTVNASNFENLPEYSDYHQLFPVNQNDANAVRSNFPLGEVVNVLDTYLDAKFGTNRYGQQVYEPRDSHKGDAARALMYQAVCYNGINGKNWSFPGTISYSIPYGQEQTLLKNWHDQDPPDNYEIARNDFLDSLQHNRNPFIDHPEYACYIDFTTMTYMSSPQIPCNIVGIEENKHENDFMSISPNPSQGDFILNYSVSKNTGIQIKIIDILGRVIYIDEIKTGEGINSKKMNLENINEGVYFVELTNANKKQTLKLIID